MGKQRTLGTEESQPTGSQLYQAVHEWSYSETDNVRDAEVFYPEQPKDQESTDLLEWLGKRLQAEKYRVLSINPCGNKATEAPTALAEALFNISGPRHADPLKRYWHKLQSNRQARIPTLGLLALLLFGVYTWGNFWADNSIHTHDWHSYGTFLLSHILQLIVSAVGIPTILTLLNKQIWREKKGFGKEDGDQFKTVDGYCRAFRHLNDQLPTVVLMDHADSEQALEEIAILNRLLNKDDDEELRGKLPRNFRLLLIAVGFPRGLIFSSRGRKPKKFPIPRSTSAQKLRKEKAKAEARKKIDVFVTAEESKARPEVWGLLEWVAFEAALDRWTVAPGDLIARYEEFRKSDVFVLTGFQARPPKRLPSAWLTGSPLRAARGRGDLIKYDPLLISQARKFLTEHRRRYMLSGWLMLMVPGVARLTNGGHWRSWEAGERQSVVESSNAAVEIANVYSPLELIEGLSGTQEVREQFVGQLFESQVVAAEILAAKGFFQRSLSLLKSAAVWFEKAPELCPATVRDRMFYGLWMNFQYCCDPELRTWLRAFAERCPVVMEVNSWRVLENLERRQSCESLLDGVTDPGDAFPELGNIYHFTLLCDRLIRFYGDDESVAGTDPNFDRGVYREEPGPSLYGLALSNRHERLRRAQAAEGGTSQEAEPTSAVPAAAQLTTLDELLVDNISAFQSAIWLWGRRVGENPPTEAERRSLIGRLQAVELLAAAMGATRVEMGAIRLEGWVYQIRDELEPLAAAEQCLSRSLDFESRMGWVINTVNTLGRRVEVLQRLDADRCVDDVVATYRAVAKAGYPTEHWAYWLATALTATTNHGSKREHYIEKAKLHEEVAELVLAGGPTSTNPSPETFAIRELSFAADAYRSLDERDSSERVLRRCRELLVLAKEKERDPDSIRIEENDVRVVEVQQMHSWSRDMERELALIDEVWSTMRASDPLSSHAFYWRLLLESGIGVLAKPWRRDEGGQFEQDSLSEEFRPDETELKTYSDGISLFEWRLLQVAAASEQLKESGPGNFARLIRYFGELATCQTGPELLELKASERKKLIELLDWARAYFEQTDTSNRLQGECNEMIRALDPDTGDALRASIVALEHENEILRRRDAALGEAAKSQDWFSRLEARDRARSEAEYEPKTSVANRRIESLLSIEQEARSYFVQGRFAEALKLLSETVRRFTTQDVLELHLCILYLFTIALYGASEVKWLLKGRSKYDEWLLAFVTQRRASDSVEQRQQFAAIVKRDIAAHYASLGSEMEAHCRSLDPMETGAEVQQQ